MHHGDLCVCFVDVTVTNVTDSTQRSRKRMQNFGLLQARASTHQFHDMAPGCSASCSLRKVTYTVHTYRMHTQLMVCLHLVMKLIMTARPLVVTTLRLQGQLETYVPTVDYICRCEHFYVVR